MIVTHKIELKPNNKQKGYFSKACGVARFSYNWALNRWNESYQEGKKTSEISLRRELNAIKRIEYPWMLEVTKTAPQQAVKNLGSAFKRFFNKQGGYPKFKKKGMHDSFRADNGPQEKGRDALKIVGKKIQLPVLGWVRLKEELRYVGQIKSVTIVRKACKWYAAIVIDTEKRPHVRKNQGMVGIDLGINKLATLSDGTVIQGPKAYKSLLKTLRLRSKSLSRKKIGSKNRQKDKMHLARLHMRISNIRNYHLHKLTTYLVLNYTKICIEDLNISGMAANRRLARHIMDQAFYTFRRQLIYKSEIYGSRVYIADRFYPSSKLCCSCGIKNKDLKLGERRWRCVCGIKHDRDINAAKNLENLLIKGTVSSTGSMVKTIKACGDN